MKRKLWACLVFAFLLTGLGRTAAAAENLGSIHIQLKSSRGEVALFRAGAPVEGGYCLTSAFGGGFIKAEAGDS